MNCEDVVASHYSEEGFSVEIIKFMTILMEEILASPRHSHLAGVPSFVSTGDTNTTPRMRRPTSMRGLSLLLS
jgi:hypothetical protein